MLPDPKGEFRPLIYDAPPSFKSIIENLWAKPADFPDFNARAFNEVEQLLKAITQERESGQPPQSRCLLLLGEAGSGKTHLLSRVAKALSAHNHIVYVTRPLGEGSVYQHVWTETLNSLRRVPPAAKDQTQPSRNQLDDLLAHVFSRVLIPEFERDIEESKDAAQKQSWVNKLKKDPFNLFTMLGSGENRTSNMNAIRKRTLQYLQQQHPNVDQAIASALITYCLTAAEDRKRRLLSWLSWQELSDEDAKGLGLPESWVTVTENTSPASLGKQRENQALRALVTLGVLSTYYQPLILAFDQLEGLQGDEALTKNWGDAVREIVSQAPNMLLIVSMFPSRWTNWFNRDPSPALDVSAIQRISNGNDVTLEKFTPKHAKAILSLLLKEYASHIKLLDRPSPLYPFSDEDVAALCPEGTVPRVFIQAAQRALRNWAEEVEVDPAIVTEQEVDRFIQDRFRWYELAQREKWNDGVSNEEQFFGRVRYVIRKLGTIASPVPTYETLALGGKVMPENRLIHGDINDRLLVAVCHASGNSCTHRVRNLLEAMSERNCSQKHGVVLRDRRCSTPGKAAQTALDEFREVGGFFLLAGHEEWSRFMALADALIAVEQEELVIGTQTLDLQQLVDSLRRTGLLMTSEILREVANRAAWLNAVLRNPVTPQTPTAPPSSSNPQPRSSGSQAVTPVRPMVKSTPGELKQAAGNPVVPPPPPVVPPPRPPVSRGMPPAPKKPDPPKKPPSRKS